MLITWVLVIIPIAASQEAQSSEETHNVTRLYPIANTIDHIKYRKNRNENKSENTYNDTEEKTKDEISTKKNKSLTWKIDTVYLPNSTAGEDISSDVSEEQASRPKTELLSAERAVEGKPEPKPENMSEERLKTDKVSEENPKQMSDDKPSKEISVDRSRTKSEETQKSNSEEKEFRPSPHLGNFFDDENLNLLKFSSPGPITHTKKKPSLDYISSKELYMLNYRRPGEHSDPPYRFQTSHSPKTPSWNTLETRPTVESSVKIPAGGLYRHPDPFREKPSSDGEAGDFGLGFSEDDREKENPVKKRSNPWRGLVRVLTAFLPVGLLISALTPSVLTLHSTDNGPRGRGRGRLSRRGDGGFAASEGCRRRLLCEIHADENYMR